MRGRRLRAELGIKPLVVEDADEDDYLPFETRAEYNERAAAVAECVKWYRMNAQTSLKEARARFAVLADKAVDARRKWESSLNSK